MSDVYAHPQGRPELRAPPMSPPPPFTAIDTIDIMGRGKYDAFEKLVMHGWHRWAQSIRGPRRGCVCSFFAVPKRHTGAVGGMETEQDLAEARGGDGGYAVGRSRRGRDTAPATWSSCRHGGVVVRSRFMAEVAVAVSVLVELGEGWVGRSKRRDLLRKDKF